MRPLPVSPSPSSSSSFSSAGCCFRSFKSPIPYLFGGLALTLSLIAIALLMLVCSNRNQSLPPSNSSGCDDEEGKVGASKTTSDSEPKILVIMAGHSNPTYLAKPLPSSSSTATQQVL
ncbi:hypothetical protein QN277_011634 [Acacia crassicarpa]|uniref:Uncharacterized protein n=1 Tax=Acacia crassicarpa TaxID=499986 RepID=A0AAE1MZ35_9FABA|nr:hypothetical protein QN277_011634 [Acacia crassicarpa]